MDEVPFTPQPRSADLSQVLADADELLDRMIATHHTLVAVQGGDRQLTTAGLAAFLLTAEFEPATVARLLALAVDRLERAP